MKTDLPPITETNPRLAQRLAARLGTDTEPEEAL